MRLAIPVLLNCALVLGVYLADKYTAAKKLPPMAKQMIIGLLFGGVSAFASSYGVQWLGIIWLGVMTDAVAYLLWALALKGVEDTAKIANLAYLTPFLSVVCSALVLKEKIKLQALVALVLIIGGILLQSLCERKKEK